MYKFVKRTEDGQLWIRAWLHWVIVGGIFASVLGVAVWVVLDLFRLLWPWPGMSPWP